MTRRGVFLKEDVTSARKAADGDDFAGIDLLKLPVDRRRNLARSRCFHGRRKPNASPARQIHHVTGEHDRRTIALSGFLAHVISDRRISGRMIFLDSTECSWPKHLKIEVCFLNAALGDSLPDLS